MDELTELRERMGRLDAMRTCVALLIARSCPSNDAITRFSEEAERYAGALQRREMDAAKTDLSRQLARAEVTGFLTELREIDVTAKSLLLP